MLKILFHKKDLFPLAVNFAVKGYHFFKITEEIIKAEEFSTMLEDNMDGLRDEIAEILQKGNAAIASKMEKYKAELQNKTAKKYRQMNNDMQVYLNERLNKFHSYADSIITQWKEKLHLQSKREDN